MHKKDYEKLKQILPLQKDMLKDKKNDLKAAKKLIDSGYKKFLSRDGVIHIKFAEFKTREKKLKLFIESEIKKMEESIDKIEYHIRKYEEK